MRKTRFLTLAIVFAILAAMFTAYDAPDGWYEQNAGEAENSREDETPLVPDNWQWHVYVARPIDDNPITGGN